MDIQTLIDNHIRPKLDDDEEVRWDDDQMVNIIMEVVDQVGTILNRHGLQFAKEKATIATVADQDYIDVSAQSPPIASIIDIYDPSTKKPLKHEEEDGWERLVSPAGVYHYMWLDGKIYLKSTPSAVGNLTMYYWPDIDTSAYTVGTSMPWGDRLNFIIAQQVVVICQNVDEMDIAMDDKWLKALELKIARKFSGLHTRKVARKGWNPRSFEYSDRGYYG